MYNFSLILGLVFSIYITVLVLIAVKRVKTTEFNSDTPKMRRTPRIREQEELFADISAVDDHGTTTITWTPPARDNYVATKVYLRVSNNPAAAVARYEVLRSEKTTESIAHNRNGSRFWYWITLLYQDGTESEKQFVDVFPNSDD